MKTRILSIATAIILLILILVLFLPLNFGFNTFYSLNREVKELRESVDLNVELAQKTANQVLKDHDTINALNVYRDDLLRRFAELSERLGDM